MNPPLLVADDFSVFFRELWNCDPFPWQREFARRLCAGQAPDYVAVPTGSGKTACLDAAIFALAIQAALPMAERTQGRRIFFIVNRRVIVDEAYDRAGKLCKELRHAASDSVAGRVAAALRKLSGEVQAAPLTRVQLRGGIYRDRSWVGSLLQPMIICSTVDQAGSRLLFRGYGVSPQARPIHAALVAQDSLLIIDEAHISRPFIQTLEWVKLYRLHQPAGCETVQLPFQLIQMTATPPADTRDDQKITLTTQDHEHPVLNPRLLAAKPARLITEPKAKGKAREEQMAKRLAEEVEKILAENHPRSIAIMVNRVATARTVAERFEKEHKGRVTLLIGRLRPLDREAVTREIQGRLKTGAVANTPESGPLIVVSTQCLEVGADLDFDALVTEAASLDALCQRFGRLNRGGRPIAARAVIVLPGDQNLAPDKLDEAAPCDLIYGNATPRTWNWLNSFAQDGVVDFGINAMTAAIDSLRTTDSDALRAMLSSTSDAPVLLPAYLDCWVQTNPTPAADPDVGLFLHGPQRDMAEVQVCWRGDLPEAETPDDWADILSFCPPTAAECLPVPLHVFHNWLGSRGRFEDSSADVAEIQRQIEKKTKEEERGIKAFVWRGPDDHFFATRSTTVRPGDTIVLRVQNGGWETLGHVPAAPADPQSTAEVLSPSDTRLLDVAERAARTVRHRAVFRIHDALLPRPEESTAAGALRRLSQDKETDWTHSEIIELLNQLLIGDSGGWCFDSTHRAVINHLARRRPAEIIVTPYPGYNGFVVSTRVLMSSETDQKAEGNNEGIDSLTEATELREDAEALLEAAQPQELCNHTRDVLDQIEKNLVLLPLSAWREALIAATMAHDWGKADPRFQAMLRGTTPFAALASDILLAKSGSVAFSAAARRNARLRAALPEGFRHEMLSVQMAESAGGGVAVPKDEKLRALALHLITTHHGYGRPFAPLVHDDTPTDVKLPLNGEIITVTALGRREHPVHALDSGLGERFWQMNRRYGWWGIALLETVLRLADQYASASQHKVKP